MTKDKPKTLNQRLDEILEILRRQEEKTEVKRKRKNPLVSLLTFLWGPVKNFFRSILGWIQRNFRECVLFYLSCLVMERTGAHDKIVFIVKSFLYDVGPV